MQTGRSTPAWPGPIRPWPWTRVMVSPTPAAAPTPVSAAARASRAGRCHSPASPASKCSVLFEGVGWGTRAGGRAGGRTTALDSNRAARPVWGWVAPILEGWEGRGGGYFGTGTAAPFRRPPSSLGWAGRQTHAHKASSTFHCRPSTPIPPLPHPPQSTRHRCCPSFLCPAPLPAPVDRPTNATQARQGEHHWKGRQN